MTVLIENSVKRSTVLSTSEQRSCWYCAALCTLDSAGTLSSSSPFSFHCKFQPQSCYFSGLGQRARRAREGRRTGRVGGGGGGGKGGEGWCRSSMLTRIDTSFQPSSPSHLEKHPSRRGYNANVGARKPCRYHRVQCRQLHMYTYMHVHVSI